MNHQKHNGPTRASRFRRLMHYLITVGLLLQVLPAPVAAAETIATIRSLSAPIVSESSAPRAAEAAVHATALGDSVLPAWMQTEGSGESEAGMMASCRDRCAISD